MQLVLEIFLLVNLVVIGYLINEFVGHFWARHHKATPTQVETPLSLSPETRAKLDQELIDKYRTALTAAAHVMQQDLSGTSVQLKGEVQTLAEGTIKQELEEYRASMQKLRQESMALLSVVQHHIDEERTKMEAELQKEAAAERERLAKALDTKLNQAITSFLIETLQHNVDLGAQSAYLTKMLEEHKAELIKEVTNEA